MKQPTDAKKEADNSKNKEVTKRKKEKCGLINMRMIPRKINKQVKNSHTKMKQSNGKVSNGSIAEMIKPGRRPIGRRYN